ncbi:MAG: hypothetical protein M0D53_05440 [Flavobacterium sp. JAD_PAG50586_2]|nr:MAG: hypothetical protein M0D53_05440 [Flavobacterium sp. JAD_PAG50586_2]
MTSKTINSIYFVLTNILVFLLVFLNKENVFFWDTIQLASEHGSFYYNNNFSKLLLPVWLDSGHIPAFGMYLALIWKIFGKSIEVSHLAMLPFAFGIVWQLQILCKRFIPEKFVGIALLLIFIDATLMSQITLVSPDVPLMFFFLWALNSVFSNRKTFIAISVFCLFLTSMRGMMLSVCLVFLDVYVNYGFQKKITKEYILVFLKMAILYFPALLLFIAFSLYHYQEAGWIGYHKDSPWADCFERVDFKGFVRNIAFLGWRIIDFGRIGVWLVFGILFIRYKSLIYKQKKNHTLYYFFIVLLILLPLNMLWAKNLMGNRYLIPIYITFSLVTASILFSDFVERRLRIVLILIWIIIASTGNLWIYPPKIAKGSDATLAHLPYYKLRLSAIKYLDSSGVDFKDVDTFFPNYYPIAEIDLKNDNRSFDNFTIGNNSKYIFYSNIFNVDDEVYDYMLKNYTVLKRFDNNRIYVIIFKLK